MRVAEPADGFVVRLDEVLARLVVLAETPPLDALTDPGPPTGEQWDWSQVWAHMVEFVPYWIEQIRLVLDTDTHQAVPFGRVKTDPDRIAGIEVRRYEPVAGLFARLSEEVADLKAFLADLSEEDWRRTALHQTRGVMPMDRIVDEFLVGHLEEHLAQLESLAPPGARTR